MGGFSHEAIEVLNFLLPGLVATAIFYSLTSHLRPSTLERVIHALIFTTLCQATTFVINWMCSDTYACLTTLQRSIWDSLVPIGMGVLLALITVTLLNHDIFHTFFRWVNVSRETSYPSEWYSAFAKNSDCYVVLHLNDGRRFYGWPSEWPTDPSNGHFQISEGEWLSEEDGSKSSEEATQGVYAMVIPVEHVELVEFMKSLTDGSED